MPKRGKQIEKLATKSNPFAFDIQNKPQRSNKQQDAQKKTKVQKPTMKCNHTQASKRPKEETVDESKRQQHAQKKNTVQKAQ